MRFTIRDLLWLILLAAVLVVSWMDHQRQAAELQKLNETFGPLEGAGVHRYSPPPNPSADGENLPSALAGNPNDIITGIRQQLRFTPRLATLQSVRASVLTARLRTCPT